MVTTVLCLFAPEGLAASRQSRERAAKKACLTGDPAKGVEILADLFIESNDVVYIFNQGRCFEQNRRYEDAIGRFREFLIKGEKLKANEKTEAERHIAACQSYLATPETREPAAQEQARPLRAEPAPQPKVPVVEAPLVVTAPRAPQVAETGSGSGLRIAGLITGGAGVAGIVTGVVLNLKANSMASDLEKPESYSRSTDSTRKDYKTLAWVSYGAGAGLVACGAVMYYLSRRKAQESSSAVIVSPVVSSSMVGTMMTGAF
jgi:hypothetical protein